MSDIDTLSSVEESEILERKERLNERALETVSAFSNRDGGTMVLGVNTGGDAIDIDISDRALQTIANKISDNLRVQPAISLRKWQGKPVIVIDVRSSRTPVAYRGRYYVRVGTTTRAASPDELGRLFLEKWGITWDAVSVDESVEELDGESIQHFIAVAGDRLPELSEDEPQESILQKLELLQDGKPTRAAVLLFGKHPQRYVSSATVHIGRFKEGGVILDDKLLEGNLFRQVDEAMKILRQYLQVRYEFTGDAERKEIWDYPLEALREAIINAIIHRDYLSTMDVQVRVYDDRILIWNPGDLPSDLTMDELRRDPHRSLPHNPLLARVFYYAGLIERWGTGTTRIIRLCSEQGLPEPEFIYEDKTFRVHMAQDPYTPERLKRMGLSDRQLEAVQYVKEREKITNAEYQELCGVKKRQATDDLGMLEEKGVLEKIGTTGKGTHYVLKGR